ncbi:MAG: preprotein translocase subunit SecG [Verrucomicrobia bacterium]|jgi:preprotein translocase subunit SecG|nr:preprotein translocase subunit SecG [Verrucomicrobiota bacterium]
MSILIGFLTVLLVLTCLFLGLLVLIQLPKKDAGAGTAFGGGMTDAVMGAGSGNVLTMATRYAAGTFLCTCLLLSVLKTNEANSGDQKFNKALQQAAANAPAIPAATTVNTNVGLPKAAAPAPAKPAEPAAFPGATPTAPGESLFPGATPTAPGATPTAPGESLFPGATPTAPK